MTDNKWQTLDELAAQWADDPEYVAAELRQKPYYDVGQDVFELRQAVGKTQAELAELANTFQSRISKLEGAELDFKLSTLIKVAEALDAHVEIRLVRNGADAKQPALPHAAVGQQPATARSARASRPTEKLPA